MQIILRYQRKTANQTQIFHDFEEQIEEESEAPKAMQAQTFQCQLPKSTSKHE